MVMIKSSRSRSRSRVLNGSTESPKLPRTAPNRSATDSRVMGVCSATEDEQIDVLFGLLPEATNVWESDAASCVARLFTASRVGW